MQVQIKYYLGIFWRSKASTVCQSHTLYASLICCCCSAWFWIHQKPGCKNPLSVREGCFLLTDGYSIPGTQASPERCQDVEWNNHGEADWHFFTPTCLISAATSRHVGHNSHSMNAAPSHRHIRTAMAAAAEQIGQWWLLITGWESFKSVKMNKAIKHSVLLPFYAWIYNISEAKKKRKNLDHLRLEWVFLVF